MSEINVTKISSKAANTPPQIVDNGDVEVGQFCRAWVNFNGTGVVAIRDSFNVSSITDNGTGDYTVNFTVAMPNANYCVSSSGQLDDVGGANGDVISGAYRSTASRTVSSYRTSTCTSAGTVIDPVSYEMQVFAN